MTRESLVYICLLLGIVFFIAFLVLLVLSVLKRPVVDEQERNPFADTTVEELTGDLLERSRAIRSVIAMDGVNPNPLMYLQRDDAGHPLYSQVFTFKTLPRVTQFGQTFQEIIHSKNCRLAILIEPEDENTSIRKLDHQITVLDEAHGTAAKRGDRNRIRKVDAQIVDAETWASRVDEGNEKFFNVAFGVVLTASSIEELSTEASKFYLNCKKHFTIGACYGAHAEAFLSCAPLHTRQKFGFGPIRDDGLATHRMSWASLADIFGHISSDFMHEEGIPIARNRKTARLMMYNVFSKHHTNGYGIYFAGKTGSGKSTMIKGMAARNWVMNPRYRFACIDAKNRGNRGEYAPLADFMHGVVFEIKNGGLNTINLYELDVQEYFDERLGREFQTLKVYDKISEIVLNYKIMVQDSRDDASFDTDVTMERLLTDVVSEQFAELGIVEGEPASLFEEREEVKVSGEIALVKCKKKLPTICGAYQKLLQRYYGQVAMDESHRSAVRLLLDALKDHVKYLAYAVKDHTVYFYSKEELADMELDATTHTPISEHGPVTIVCGIRAYFDGQSTVTFSRNCPFTDFDISFLPKRDQPVARQIIHNFISEQFIKKNSEDIRRAEPLVVILEENHESYPYKNCRLAQENQYRTNRSRHVSTWICTQKLSDGRNENGMLYPEVEGILANTATFILFKQPPNDREFLRKYANLSDEQIDEVIAQGGSDECEGIENAREHYGEFCIIDGGKVCFGHYDYLRAAEARFAETNASELAKPFQDARQEVS